VRLLVPGEGDYVRHAQLTLGGGMIMLGSVRPDESGALLKQPDEIGGAETQSCYLVVPNVDEVHAKALARGGREVSAPVDQEHRGRFCVIADPEGHVWAIGSYDPWA